MLARLPDGLIMLPLLLALVACMWTVGMNLGGPGVHDLLHPWDLSWSLELWPVEYSRYRGIDDPTLPGVELIVVPLAAVAAATLRLGAERIVSLREKEIAPYLPLLMAVSGLIAAGYIIWSWGLPQARYGPDDFGFVRWLGTALLAGLTWFWLPLFPRVTAKLAGMIGGPALFAGLGYLLFADVITNDPLGYCEGSCAVFAFILVCVVFVLEVLILVSKRLAESPTAHAVWTGALMAGLAAFGTTTPV